jgi:phenylacetate-coenzyme A ligase PaaK-like adenylate-forming protein
MIPHLIAFLLKRDHLQKKQDKSAKKALRSFQRLGRTDGWYQTFLEKSGCTVSDIRSVNDFTNHVPLVSKESVFNENPFIELTRCNLREVQSIMLSSGQSGNFSTGIITRRENQKLAVRTDLFLNIFFGIKKREALIINASAMGVRVFTYHTCCDTGPRSDIVITLLKEVSPSFPKTIISADPHLIKQIVEEAIVAGVDWQKLKVWFISGGDWFPETLRGYVHSLTGKSALVPDNGFWLAIYGLTELGYPLFFETAQLAALRGEFYSNKDLITERLSFQQGRCTTPFLFHLLQSSFYLEQVSDASNVPELVFTTLDPSRAIPLIRYNTHDVGELTEHTAFDDVKYPLPLVAFWGRNQNWLTFPTTKVMVTDMKELLFTDYSLNEKITGFFTLQVNNGKVVLAIQLKKGKIASPVEEERFIQLVNQFYPDEMMVSFEKYHWFDQQMELDFERKFNHLKANHHG